MAASTVAKNSRRRAASASASRCNCPTASRRAAAEAGLPVVSQREADDLVRDAESFLVQVAAVIGVDQQSILPNEF